MSPKNVCFHPATTVKGGSRSAATSKMECFVIIVNGFKLLIVITKRSILDVAVVLDPSLTVLFKFIMFIHHV